MARRIRYSELENPTARRRLKVGVTHWRSLDPKKLTLGYRRSKAALPGVWLKRAYRGVITSKTGKTFPGYQTSRIATADDLNDADGINVLSFGEAQVAARMVAKSSVNLMVRAAMAAYIEFLRAEGKSKAAIKETERRVEVHILPELGDLLVEDLTSKQLRKWFANLADRPALVRSKKGEPRAVKAAPLTDPEVIRRRRSSANRILTVLKAGLNHVFDEEKVNSNAAWGRRLKPFKGVDAARVRYLTLAECQRFLNAVDDDYRPLIRAALETGARYSELTRLQCTDFNPDAGTIHVRKSKSVKGRHIVLTDDGRKFFRQLVAGRAGTELMLWNIGRVRRAKIEDDAGEWRASEQRRPLIEALERAKIEPFSFHSLRHTWASLAVMNGVPLMVVAKNLGHRDTLMVEKHYGHLAPSYIADAIRAGAPRYGAPDKSNVRSLR